MSGFGDRLAKALTASAPLCVGIDPSAQLLDHYRLPDTADGLRSFGAAVLAAVDGLVAVVKPQSAFFERHGSAGVAVLEDLCRDAQSRGLLVLLDVKRGDVGSTTEAYAEAYLDAGSPFAVDAITASAYLGVGALAPLFDAALASDRGVFVVARSSNPEGEPIQTARVAGGGNDGGGGDTGGGGDVVGHVLAELAAVNARATGGEPVESGRLGSIGAVFGATCDPAGYDLARLGGPILAPGLGAQGATVADIAARFADCRDRVLPSASRSILRAGPDVAAMRAATAELAAECGSALHEV